jgi:hypothetical protein
VLACPNEPVAELASDAEALGIPHNLIGDCLAARTCEEAVYEALKVATAI